MGTAFLYLQRSKQPNLSGWSWNTPHTHYDGWLETESCVKEETLMALSWKCEGEEGGVHVQTHTSRLAQFLSTDWVDETEGWCWWRRIYAQEQTRKSTVEKNKRQQEKKRPLRRLAVCKLQLNSTNRHTERFIIARDTKVLAVHMASASSPEMTCSLSCLLRTRKYNRIYI